MLVIGAVLGLLSAACSEDSLRSSTDRIQVRTLRETALHSWLADEDVIDVLAASESTLIVSVQNGAQLALIDWSGALKSVVAPSGRGPGEVLGAVWLVPRDKHRFASIDIISRRLSWWRTDGRHLEDHVLESSTISGVWDGNGHIVVRSMPGSQTMRFSRIDDTGSTSVQFDERSRALASGSSCGYCAAAVGTNGTVALASADTSYTIFFRDSHGDSVGIVHVDVPVVALTREEADSVGAVWRMIEDRVRANDPRESSLRRIRDAAAASGYKKRFIPRAFLIDEKGLLWAQRSVNRGDSAEVDLVDRRRGRIGILRLAPGAELRRVRGRHLIVVRSMEDGSSRVTELLVESR